MPQRLIRLAELDWQLIGLNATSVGSIIASYISENSTGWAVAFLIVTVGILNLAKAYSVVKNKKK